MAMMAKMRDLAPAFIITVGVLFVLFMIISDSNVLEVLGARTNNIGSVNGRDITYQEFAQLLERALENQKQQTGQEVTEDQLDQFRDQVWESLVSQIITEQQMEKLGITVSDQEIRDVILGENPPEFLKQNFIDSNGVFNRQMYESAIFDSRNKEALIQAEEAIRQQLMAQKLQSILMASVSVTEQEIKRKFIEQNIKMTAQFALIDLNSYPDTMFNVSDDEIRKYYNNNPNEFSIKAQRKLKHVTFKVLPSKRDSSNVFEQLQNVYAKALNDTSSFKTWVDIYSETPYSRDTTLINSLPVEVADLIVNSSAGDLIGPIAVAGQYKLYKVINSVTSNETFVRASHILIPSTGSDADDLAEANKVYEAVKSGLDFREAAIKYSKDPGSAEKGGDLGWFGKGMMVKEFEDACFKGDINVIQKPVKTNFGYHIIKVTGKTNKKFVLENISMSVKASAFTRDEIYNQANDFAYIAEKNGFEKEAKNLGYEIQETTPFMQDAFAVPGIGYNKAIIDFAFDNGLNTVSQVYKIPSGYVVVMVSDVINAGVKKFDEVINEAKASLIKQKKYEKALAEITELKNKVGNNLDNAKEFNPKVRVDTTGSFSTAGSIPKVGVEYNFSANAYKLPLGKVSDPIKGVRGYFLIKVLTRTDFDSTVYSLQKNTLRDNLLQERRNSFISQWLQKMKEEANIIDRRHLFYSR